MYNDGVELETDSRLDFSTELCSTQKNNCNAQSFSTNTKQEANHEENISTLTHSCTAAINACRAYVVQQTRMYLCRQMVTR